MTFKASEHVVDKYPQANTNDKSYYVFKVIPEGHGSRRKMVAGPFSKWLEGKEWIEEQRMKELRK